MELDQAVKWPNPWRWLRWWNYYGHHEPVLKNLVIKTYREEKV